MNAEACKKTTVEKFSDLNRIASRGGVVLFGASYMERLPMCELAQDYGLKEKIYNRSISGMTAAEALHNLDCCVNRLSPEKVFINIGESDILLPDYEKNAFLRLYEQIINQIRTASGKVKIYIVSVYSPENPVIAEDLNKALCILAEKTGCSYIDIAGKAKYGDVEVFSTLSRHMHVGRITFADAMGITHYTAV